MSYLITALHSREDEKAGFGVFDTETGLLRYLQILDVPLGDSNAMFRGIHCEGDFVIAATKTGISIIVIDSIFDGPILSLKKHIVLSDWIEGKQQPDIVSVVAWPEKNRITVGNNRLCSLDSLDFQGNLIERRHLWEIVPELISPPVKGTLSTSQGYIKYISKVSDGALYITVANCNGTKQGAIIRLDDCEVIKSDIQTPHGGIFYNDTLIYQNVSAASLHAYKMVDGKIKEQKFEVSLPPPKGHQTHHKKKLRWATEMGGVIWCGALHFDTIYPEQILPRIVGFDARTGEMVSDFSLPHIDGFRWSRPFGISPAPGALVEAVSKLSEAIAWDKCISFEIKHSAEKSIQTKRLPKKKQRPEKSHLPDRRITAIEFSDVGLCYKRSGRFAIGRNKHLRKSRNYWALKDVSFTIYKGECVGVIGRNGSGKSTLSMLCAGVFQPDKGFIKKYGKARLLSLGVGFRPDFTGRENVRISASILGLSRRETEARMSDIESFADLGEFIDEPVRTYSAGMRSRLGFAIATTVVPDILILDEAMSTGDASFRKKAEARMETMLADAGTVIMVSHNPGIVKKLCDRVIWIEKSRLLMDGEPEEIVSDYKNFCDNPKRWYNEHQDLL